MCSSLLQHKADPHWTTGFQDETKGGTALHQVSKLALYHPSHSPLQACRGGHAQAVQALLSELDHAGLEARDSKGTTPLYTAADRGHAEIVRALLDVGACGGSGGGTKSGMSPAIRAAFNGHLSTLKVLTGTTERPPSHLFAAGAQRQWCAYGRARVWGHHSALCRCTAGAQCSCSVPGGTTG